MKNWRTPEWIDNKLKWASISIGLFIFVMSINLASIKWSSPTPKDLEPRLVPFSQLSDTAKNKAYENLRKRYDELSKQGIWTDENGIHQTPGLKWEVTGYCLKGIMASGKEVYNGAVACPTLLKLGTKIKIEGQEYICEDRMAQKYRNGFYIDKWFANCDDALKWGRRLIQVSVEETNKTR